MMKQLPRDLPIRLGVAATSLYLIALVVCLPPITHAEHFSIRRYGISDVSLITASQRFIAGGSVAKSKQSAKRTAEKSGWNPRETFNLSRPCQNPER